MSPKNAIMIDTPIGTETPAAIAVAAEELDEVLGDGEGEEGDNNVTDPVGADEETSGDDVRFVDKVISGIEGVAAATPTVVRIEAEVKKTNAPAPLVQLQVLRSLWQQ